MCGGVDALRRRLSSIVFANEFIARIEVAWSGAFQVISIRSEDDAADPPIRHLPTTIARNKATLTVFAQASDGFTKKNKATPFSADEGKEDAEIRHAEDELFWFENDIPDESNASRAMVPVRATVSAPLRA
jgi:hypothetical protein